MLLTSQKLSLNGFEIFKSSVPHWSVYMSVVKSTHSNEAEIRHHSCPDTVGPDLCCASNAVNILHWHIDWRVLKLKLVRGVTHTRKLLIRQIRNTRFNPLPTQIVFLFLFN